MVKMLGVLGELFFNLNSDFSSEGNGVDIENIENASDQRSLGTTSYHIFQGRAATTESTEHFPVFKITHHQSK